MTLDKPRNRLHTLFIIHDLQRFISSGTMPIYPGLWLVRGCGEHQSDHAPNFSFDLGNNLHSVAV